MRGVEVVFVDYGSEAVAALRARLAAARGGDPLAPATVVVPSAAAGLTLRRALAPVANVAFVPLAELAGRFVAGVERAPASVARAHVRAVAGGLVEDPAVAAGQGTVAALELTFTDLAALDAPALATLEARGGTTATTVALYRRWRQRLRGAAVPADTVPLAAAALAARAQGAAPDRASMVDAGSAAGPGAAGEADAAPAGAWPAGAVTVAGEAGPGAAGTSPAGEADAFPAGAVSVPGEADPGAAGASTVTGVGPVLVHLPRRLDGPALRFLGSLAEHTPVTVVLGRTGHPEADEPARGMAAALGAPWPPPSTGPPALPDRIVLVPDPAEEVAMAVREVAGALRRGVRPERIAAVSRVRDPYAAALHEALGAAGIPHHGPRSTTAAQSPAGRVLLAALDLPAGDFRRTDVAALLRAAPLRCVDAPLWDLLAKEAGVLRGLDQWAERPAVAAEARARWLDPAEIDDDRRIQGWAALAAFVADLAARLTPPADQRWATWAPWAAGLLDHLLDPEVADRDAVTTALAGLAVLDGVEAPPTPERFRAALEAELDRPDGSHGRFGVGVLVGRLADVVGADLDLVVVLGAADGVLPPRRHDDTLVPERDRAAPGVGLAPRAPTRAEEHRDLLAALAAAPERVLVGPRADPRAQRERQPAPWLLEAASARAGRLVGGGDLPSLRGEPWFVDVPSFEAVPATATTPATPQDLDLADLLADHAAGPDALLAGAVAAEDPDLARGLAAALARRAGRFDEWSGNVGARPELVSGLERPRSPTGLEQYAACPFRFFLGNVLRLGAVDDPNDVELISPLDEGSLVHEVLERFVEGSLGKPPHEPWSEDDRRRLLGLLDEVADRYRDAGRTGKALLWGVRQAQLRHQLLRVLAVDEALRAGHGVAPAAVEHGFGFDGTPPVTIDVGGRTVAFKGTADRIDVSPDGRRLVVYDYKSGKHEGFLGVEYRGDGDGDLTASGTKLQLPIYALAARARWPDATEVETRYWFVGARSNGRTIGGPFDAAAEERFRTVVGTVVDGVEGGRFPANPGNENYRFGAWRHDNCGWCNFDRICPTTRGEAWVQIRRAPELAPYVALAEPGAE